MAVPLNALTYRTHNVHSGRFYLWVASGLFEGVEVRGDDSTVPGLRGRTARNRVANRRVIELEGNLVGQGATPSAQVDDYIAAQQDLASWFDFEVRGALVATLHNGDIYTIQALTLNITQDELSEYASHVAIEMESIDPDWVVT